MPECLFCQSNLAILLSLFVYLFIYCVLKMILLLKFYFYFLKLFIGVFEATECTDTHLFYNGIVLVSTVQQGESAIHIHISPLISISSTFKSSEH